MNSNIILLGLIAAVVVLYIIWTKYKNQKPQKVKNTSSPSAVPLPVQDKMNDKLIIIKDISFSDLQTIITEFCKMYNNEFIQAQPRLIKLTEREFAITFPLNINFEIFCFFINYLQYPTGFDKSFNVTGWATTKTSDSWITEKNANKKVMLFIPTDDTDYDNVYMTTIDNISFKLDFGMGKAKQQLDNAKKNYHSPTIDILELANKEYKDFQ
jgi:hypothetical protein